MKGYIRMKNKRKNIILIGFMGSGKTTVGLRLSYRLRMSVDDTDKMIVRRAGKSISEIFAEDGEEAFRQMETLLLQEISNRRYAQIFSVGGGTPMNPVNRELLKRCGTVVYLKISPEAVYERLKHDKVRPLLQCDDPYTKVKELLEARSGAYEECADIIIPVDGLQMEQVLEKIMISLREWEKEKENAVPAKKLLVINGPNINFLGIREKSVYGTEDYKYLLKMIADKAAESGNEIKVFQSNHEGAIIDCIQEAYFDGTQGIVINPGAYTHYSYAIRDALASITVPKVEIHISDITQREEFRKISVTAPVCDKQIYGQGLSGYLQAIDYILENFK